MDRRRLGGLDPLEKLVRGVMVHQEAQPPAIQAKDRYVVRQCFVKHMQHVAITAKRDNAVGGIKFRLAIARDKPRQAFLRHLMRRS